MKYFDAHMHVQFPQYDADRSELLETMRKEEVGGLVVGTDFESSQKAIALVEGNDTLFASVGLHPNAVEKESFSYDEFRELASNPKVVAIGECGLDNFRPENPDTIRAKQREVFEEHVRLAIELEKPLMIHARPSKGTQDAYNDALDVLMRYKKEHGDKLKGDMHFFVGGVEEARAFLEIDFTMSFTAVLTFTRDYDEVVRFLPETHILSETDAPYVAPAERRGQRNDPLAVQDVVRAIAGIRGESEEYVREGILGNARRLFAI